MKQCTLETMPTALSEMETSIEDIKNLLSEKQPPKIDTSKKKYSLKEAAAYCGMADVTFRTYIYRRKVAGIKFGKAWSFLEKDLDDFIQSYRRPTAKELENRAVTNLTKGR